ncbi:MAG: hypothetical protein HZA61_04395 [Candidatus Eisenbacteria bacterium]|uniref:YdhG-like domain-containing protein n=1 Tax=Eiseniibacteriota bacterium TaxID=2212470 RepID=A0A933SCF2_UNCEI|nr:hypothetical protein [Candidatus Eisenbacteria bacterium]
MPLRARHASVDEYLAAAAPEVRAVLEEIRRRALAAVPDATECISYQMPALKKKKVFFYYAAFKQHVGIYPPVKGDAALATELAPFRGPKGNLQFPLSAPMPFDLIARVAATLAEEVGVKSAAKGTA